MPAQTQKCRCYNRSDALVVLAWATTAGSAMGQGVLYVDVNAGPGGDGQSWATAFNSLQDGLAAATPGSGDQVWVADGTYRPAPPNGDRDISFQMKSGVEVYGGFAGGEASLEERDWVKNVTVLSGDLNGDDVDVWLDPSHNDNSFHVVVANGTSASAILDGFRITSGNTMGGDSGEGGGALFTSSAQQVVNCTFAKNWASAGGGLSCLTTLTPTLVNCQFLDNQVTLRGGAARFEIPANLVVVGCRFASNTALWGGGLYLQNGGHASLIDCEFESNNASYAGGAVGSVPHLTVLNSTFIHNTAHLGGAIYCSQDLTLGRCDFVENAARFSAGAVCFAGQNPAVGTVDRCRFLRNKSSNFGGAVYIFSNRVLFENCAFTGNTSFDAAVLYVGGHEQNVARLVNVTIHGNSALNLCGGLYCQLGLLTVENSVVWGNSDSTGQSELAQINSPGTPPTIHHSCVQGWTGSLGGIGNHGLDPLFIDADGPDNMPGTDDDDLHLAAGSPCIDTGDNDALPPGIEVDLDGNPRIVNRIVDMGCYERGLEPCPADIAPTGGDGIVNIADLMLVINAWQSTGPGLPADLNHDEIVDMTDILTVVAGWGRCP